MKKVLCVFLAILTLSFCFVLNVSAEGVQIADYDYQNFDLYKMDLNFMQYSNTIDTQKVIDFINYFGNEFFTQNIQFPDDNRYYNTIYYFVEGICNIDNYLDVNKLEKNYKYIRSISFSSSSDNSANIKISLGGSEVGQALYFYINKKDGQITRVYTENKLNKYDYSNTYILLPKQKIYLDNRFQSVSYRYINDEYKFTKPKEMVKGLSYIIDDITYIEPEVMAMRANVTYSLPYVINYVKIVVNSIFTPTGALYTIAPVAIISIAISVLLLGAYIIKRFSWGL